MSTKYHPDRKKIGNLLAMTNPPILVPHWQRSFSWTTSEVETFWEDLLRFDRQYPGKNIAGQEYFLGSVVIVDNNEDHLLLDGQQRLATSAILLSVIRDFLDRFTRDAATRVATRYLTDYNDASESITYKLTLNRYDRDFFKREVMERRNATYQAPPPERESHRLIRRARAFFFRTFEQKYKEIALPREAHRWALRVLKVLTEHVSVVAVVTNDEDNAATVFETLNDRGIGLSTPDLLRSLLLRRAAADNIDEIVDLWGEILEIGRDAALRSFLRHYWISNEGDVKTRSLYREIKSHITSAENNVDSLAFSRKLRDSSVVYRDTILAGQDVEEDIRQLLQDINTLRATVLYPAILSAYDVGESPEIKVLLRALLVTFVRHNVIGGLENSRLEDAVYSLARDLRRNRDFGSAIQGLAAFSPDDNSFRSAARTAIVARSATARYILSQLEKSQWATEELELASAARLHVEHIYPRNPRAGERWENHAFWVGRLGNQTLLSRRLNTTIRNAPFAEKKPYYKQSKIMLTQALLGFDEWTAQAVERRQSEMSAKVDQIWAFPEV